MIRLQNDEDNFKSIESKKLLYIQSQDINQTMKQVATISFCLLVHYFTNGQSFLFNNGKIDLTNTFKIERSFQFFIKTKLGVYANEYNASIYQEANKMKDYINYEDSSIISAVVKFHPVQTLQQTLWDAEVVFEKKGDSVLVKVEKLKIAKYSGFAGDAAFQDGELTEAAANKMQKSMLKKLRERIDVFFRKFQ